MLTIASKEARTHFGELMDTAQHEPVAIEKHGKPVAVLISATEYEQLNLNLLQAKVSIGFNQLDQGQQSQLSVLEIMQKAKQIHEKVQAISAS